MWNLGRHRDDKHLMQWEMTGPRFREAVRFVPSHTVGWEQSQGAFAPRALSFEIYWSVCLTRKTKIPFLNAIINWIFLMFLNVFKIYLIISRCTFSSSGSHYLYYLTAIVKSLSKDFLIYPQMYTKTQFSMSISFLVRCAHKYRRMIMVIIKGPKCTTLNALINVFALLVSFLSP